MTDATATSLRLLLRLSAEMAIKSRRTRHTFMRQLKHNLRDALRGTGADFQLESDWSRIYVESPSPQVLGVVPRVFGLSSFSPIERVVPSTIEDIVRAGEDAFRDRVAGKTFAVRARRVGTHAFTSQDVQVALGAALRPFAAGVNLDAPDVEVHVEVREREASLFSEKAAGPGGLPLGVEGKALALISGGYDSAVAAWLLLKRGVALDYVFCNLGGEAYERAVVQVAKVLADDWSYGTHPHLHVVDFTAPLDDLKAKAKQSFWQVVLKRLMYRAASKVAADLDAAAIVTGEAVGQVSSQTLLNLRAIEPAADLPVFRPLLGFDKEEIIERARRIGTAGLSEQVREYCAIAPGKPVTAASVESVAREEERLDLGIVDAAVNARKVLDLRALRPTDLVAPYLFKETIPSDAVVLDCRPEAQFRAWHLPGAEHRDEWELLHRFQQLDRNRTYVLYCAHGIQTAYLAERMQRAGYEAYSFKGGLRGVLRYAQQLGIPLP